jgi:hypothetical protein
MQLLNQPDVALLLFLHTSLVCQDIFLGGRCWAQAGRNLFYFLRELLINGTMTLEKMVWLRCAATTAGVVLFEFVVGVVPLLDEVAANTVRLSY